MFRAHGRGGHRLCHLHARYRWRRPELEPGARLAKGYEANEIVGQSFATFYPPKERERDIPELNLQHAREQRRFSDEGWRVRKDGTQFWAHVVIDAIRDEAGTLLGFTKITRDMTTQRETEHRLAHEAGHDALTGLFNRTKFLERLDNEAPQLFYGGSLAVHYVDLDRFKRSTTLSAMLSAIRSCERSAHGYRR